jgi:two-component system, sensor histidine kinase and response regulator
LFFTWPIALDLLLRKENEHVNYILCNSGEEALKCAIKEEIALIMLDVQMPVMSGYDVARLLKNNTKTKNIPIIFVTAVDHDINYIMEGFEVGAIDYLFKPLNPSITKAKVNAFLKMNLQKKELESKNLLLVEKQSELESAHDSLRKLNEQLEMRVEERTQELLKSKQRLNEANVELQVKNKQLIKTNSDLDNFIYTASHDLKAPISNIEGLVEALKSDFPSHNDDEKVLLNMITQSIERFKGTILDLTDIVKIQNEDGSDLSDLEIDELIGEIKNDVKELIDHSNAVIKESLEVTHITFSRKNLRSILYNLISNAIKYQSPDRVPEVIVRTYLEDNNIVICVKDNGLGIKKEDIPKVFKMFKRLHDHVEGTGIGMYIVKRMIDNYGGRIEVKSEVGKGSDFFVYFPQKA